MVDVLAIGAHMGDEVAWGMTLAAHKRLGLSIGMLHLTPGEKGHKSLAPEEYAAQKRIEAAECAAVLGAELWQLDYKDGELPTTDAVKHQVAAVLREARPKTIITHWRGSMHKDHTATHELIPDSRFYAGIRAFSQEAEPHWVPSVYYAENWEDLSGFVPEVFMRLTQEDMDLWERAMRCYALFRGEVATFPYLEYYKAQCRARGCTSMSGLASAFAVPEDQRKKVLNSLV